MYQQNVFYVWVKMLPKAPQWINQQWQTRCHFQAACVCQAMPSARPQEGTTQTALQCHQDLHTGVFSFSEEDNLHPSLTRQENAERCWWGSLWFTAEGSPASNLGFAVKSVSHTLNFLLSSQQQSHTGDVRSRWSTAPARCPRCRHETPRPQLTRAWLQAAPRFQHWPPDSFWKSRKHQEATPKTQCG